MPTISFERQGQFAKTALQVLVDNGGTLRSRDVVNEVRTRLDLTDHELSPNNSGRAKWEAELSFRSIGLVKVGWLLKESSNWHITPEGEAALKLSDLAFRTEQHNKYSEWRRGQNILVSPEEANQEESEEEATNSELTYEYANSMATEQLERFIRRSGPYEFQDLVAALLRGMGYHTPFIAPKGRDGGIDIQAYSDPLGTVAPRIIVQVKQRPDTKVSVQEVRELSGLLRRDGDIGLFVSTGGFTNEAASEAKSSGRHIEIMDMKRFIDLWKTHYSDMTEEDKSLLPLREIMFLAPNN
ncbi:Mrr restriction system protein [SAR202 cluster bacterium AC-647-N09_OGT_505m]|nr:Mrr restriction system protein [SAR202 cluster bacterium AC-647-N09_OGT_505m]